MSNPDLHVHTHFSDDGDFAPDELISMARELDIDIMAFADHDSIEAVPGRPPPGLDLVSGVELSSVFMDVELHLLAYGFQRDDPILAELLAGADHARTRQAAERTSRLSSLGFTADMEMALDWARGRPPKTGALLSMLLELNPIDPRLDRYGTPEVPDWFNFYRDYLAAGKPAHVSLEAVSPVEMVSVVCRMDALSVMAHPGAMLRDLSGADLHRLILELADAGLHGLEVYTSWHDRALAGQFRELAEELGLITTVGSDFHGPTAKPDIELGPPPYTPREVRREVAEFFRDRRIR